MDTVKLVLSIVQVILCVSIIGLVLSQQGATQGIGGTIEGGSSDTFFSRSNSGGVQGMLSKATAVCAVVFGIIVIAINALQ